MKHVAIRLYLYFLLILFFITGGLAMFVFAPIYKGAFAPRASYRDFQILRVWTHVYKVMCRSITNKGYRDLYPSKLTDLPEFHNDLAVMRIRESWQGAEDNCDVCKLSCCAQIKCPMLDTKGRCLSYMSIYFGYLFCGRYPSNQGQVDLYNCPKWEVGK
jgi:hypothetical protein